MLNIGRKDHWMDPITPYLKSESKLTAYGLILPPMDWFFAAYAACGLIFAAYIAYGGSPWTPPPGGTKIAPGRQENRSGSLPAVSGGCLQRAHHLTVVIRIP